jgi:hypothetical protein
VSQWRKSDRLASPFLTVVDPAAENQNRLARGCEPRRHPSPTKIYCLDEAPDTGAKPPPRPPVRAGRRRDSGKNIWEFPEGLKLGDIHTFTVSKVQLYLVALF